MKNFILLLGIMLFAGMAMGQFRVSSDGINHALNGTMIVGENAGASSAIVNVGEGRSDVGAAGFAFFHNAVSGFNNASMSMGVSRFGVTNFQSATGRQMQFRTLDASDLIFVTNGQSRMTVQETGQVDIAGALTINGGMSVTSDARLKRNVKKLNRGIETVLELNPVSFEYTGEKNTSTDRTYVGLLAQELQKIAPEFVSSHEVVEYDNEGEVIGSSEVLKIHDTEIKYLLVNAIQQQQEMIEDLQTRLDDLRASIAATDRISNSDDVDLIDIAQSNLSQNSPNPYNEGTVISYSVADNATSAKMNFYNLTGQLIKSVSLQSGAGQLNVSADELPSGTYTYSLEVDGALISNKKMVKMR